MIGFGGRQRVGGVETSGFLPRRLRYFQIFRLQEDC